MASIYGQVAGVEYRETFAKTNSYILDSLRGLKEVLLFGQGSIRQEELNESSRKLNKSQEQLKAHEGLVRALSDLAVMLGVLSVVLIGSRFYSIGRIEFGEYLIAIVLLASSFGPVVALSNLSNTLLQSFACAKRLFELMDEIPQVEDIEGDRELEVQKIDYDKVSFAYPGRENVLLNEVSMTIEKGDKVAIVGESGIGKSTFIKLLMRFFDVNEGTITVDGKDLKKIPTKALRKSQTLMTQETYLFDETIEENIKLAKPEATREEVILDEPTSNIDTLSEGEILKAIKDNSQKQTIVLISHRKSTTALCEKTYQVEQGKLVKML